MPSFADRIHEQIFTQPSCIDDDALAGMVANYLIHVAPRDVYYIFTIDHNVKVEKKGDAKTGPCPFPYTSARGNRVGLHFKDTEVAKSWLVAALKLGYEVRRHRNDRERSIGSLAQIKDTLTRRERFALVRKQGKGARDLDDEIPF